MQCMEFGLCAACGLQVEGKRVWLALYADKTEIVDEMFLHERCAKLSLAHCPHMRNAFSIIIWADRSEIRERRTVDLTSQQIKRRRLKLLSTSETFNFADMWRPKTSKTSPGRNCQERISDMKLSRSLRQPGRV